MTFRPSSEKTAHGWHHVPAWAPSPAANHQAAEVARRLNPSGSYLAHGGLLPSAVVDLLIDGQHPSRLNRAVYKPASAVEKP
jgi:hypothetical protein